MFAKKNPKTFDPIIKMVHKLCLKKSQELPSYEVFINAHNHEKS